MPVVTSPRSVSSQGCGAWWQTTGKTFVLFVRLREGPRCWSTISATVPARLADCLELLAHCLTLATSRWPRRRRDQDCGTNEGIAAAIKKYLVNTRVIESLCCRPGSPGDAVHPGTGETPGLMDDQRCGKAIKEAGIEVKIGSVLKCHPLRRA